MVRASLAPFAPPEKLVNEAKSTANLLTSRDKSKAAFWLNPNPVNRSPVFPKSSLDALLDRPKLFLRSLKASSADFEISLKTVSNLDEVSSKSLAVLTATVPIANIGAVIAKDKPLPILVADLPNLFNELSESAIAF